MLNDARCKELSHLRRLAASNDTSIVQDVPDDVRKLAGQLVRRWWKNHGLPEDLHRLDAANAEIVSEANAWRFKI
jgi:hypothetical protein